MSVKCGMRNSGSGIAVRGGAAARSAAGTMRRVKFGDVVREVKDKIDRADNPYEFYVAGDHMDTEDLKIRRRGRFATDDVGPAFTRVFKPGQILYGSRRTYLKKVCVADFEGITANTTFVLETKDENVLLQRLLPFLMLGDRFTAWSIKHSKGSTNPYVLFGDLADYEFDLPPMDEQKKLAELLWAANDLKESYKKAITATDEMLKAKFREMFGDAGDDSSRGGAETRSTIGKVKVVEFGEVAIDFRNGLSPSRRGSIHAKALTLTAVTQGVFDPTQWKDSTFDIEVPKDKYICSDDFYICRGNGNKALVGMGVFSCENHDDLVFPDTVIAAKIDTSKIIMPFLAYAWNSDGVRRQVGISAKTSSGLYKVNQERLSHIQIPLPPLALQREFVAIADKAESAKANLKKSIAAIDQVMKGLINQ